MFRRIPLIESFKFVASPAEWQTFQSSGEVNEVDRWLESLAASPGQPPGKLDNFERLRSAFMKRVHERLRSGEWICEGFSPAHGPELRLIPQQMWKVLKFEPCEDKVSGGGFSFVSILLSDTQRDPPVRPLTPAATRKIALGEIIDIVATPDEAAEYASLKSAAASPLMWILEGPETEYERRHRLCCALQSLLWERVLPRLLSGEWSAEGFVPGELQRTRIPPEIWPELQCDFSKDAAASAPDLGLQFHRVEIDLKPSTKLASTVGATRRALNEWLRKISQEQRALVRRVDLLEEARTEFGDRAITGNLLDECVRATGVGSVLLFRGRPPK